MPGKIETRISATGRMRALGAGLRRLQLLPAMAFFACLPAMAQDLPDWSGTWEAQYGGTGTGYVEQPKLSEAGWEQVRNYRRMRDAGELPESGEGINCVPIGMPDIMPSPLFLFEFYFVPDKIVVYLEAYGMVRWIHTDERDIPEDAIPAFMGYSTGHWEDDMLVVETGAVYKGTRMSIPAPDNGEMIEVRHSEDMHLTERIRLVDDDTLEIRTAITDPALFEGSAETRHLYTRHRGREWEVSEYVCAQNNRTYLDEDGKQHFILTTD
jgi:hypothetical protein